MKVSCFRSFNLKKCYQHISGSQVKLKKEGVVVQRVNILGINISMSTDTLRKTQNQGSKEHKQTTNG